MLIKKKLESKIKSRRRAVFTYFFLRALMIKRVEDELFLLIFFLHEIVNYETNLVMHETFVSPAPLGPGIAETQRG